MEVTKEYKLLKTGSTVDFGGAKARVDLFIKYNTQNISTNTTNYSIKAELVVSSGYVGEYTGATLSLTGDGISYTKNLGTGSFRTMTAGEASGNITHNSDGNKRVDCTAKITFKAWGKSVSAYEYTQLPTIPRTTSISSFSVSKVNETTLKFNWGTADTVDYVWYSTNNGSSWTGYDVTDGTSGSFNVSGLSANTTYSCKIRVRRKDSQLTTDSSTYNQTTNAYPGFATQPTFSSRTETTLNVYYKNNMTVDGAQYRIKKTGGSYGSWTNLSVVSGEWNTTAGCTFKISGLTANTSYVVQVRINSNLTDHWTESSEVSTNMYTYDYPKITSSSNFVIGNSFPITIYNPLGRSLNLKFYGNDNSLICEATRTSNGSTTINNLDYEIDNQYKSIPNSKSGTYKIRIVCSELSRDTTVNGSTYSVNENNCRPIFNDFTYKDIDSRTSSLTENNQILVNGKSDCQFTISNSNKATGTKYASITKYICEWGNGKTEINYSDTDDVIGKIYDQTGNVIKVSAVDSRGVSTTVSKTITNIQYKDAIINEVTTSRKDGVGIETYLGFKLTLWNGNWNNGDDEQHKNTLKYVGYRVYNNEQWSDYYDITDKVLPNIYVYKSDSSQTITLDTEKKVDIHDNGESGGFASGRQFQIEILIKDGDYNYTYTPSGYIATKQGIVTDGKIGMSRYKDSDGNYHYGINTMPSDEHTLYINGNAKIINDGTDTDTFVTAERSDTNVKVSMGVGSGGTNHGVYSGTLSKWLVYGDEKNVYLNGQSETSKQAKEIKGTWGGLIIGAHWYYIGDILFAGQGTVASLDLYTGEGQNGSASQNTYIKIMLKQGWGGSASPIGLTANFMQNYKSSIKIKLYHIHSGKCALYIYLPFAYNDITYVVSGSYDVFTDKHTVLDSTPTTDKEATYYNNGVAV